MITWTADETPSVDQLWDAYGDMVPECFADAEPKQPAPKGNILNLFRMLLG